MCLQGHIRFRSEFIGLLTFDCEAEFADVAESVHGRVTAVDPYVRYLT